MCKGSEQVQIWGLIFVPLERQPGRLREGQPWLGDALVSAENADVQINTREGGAPWAHVNW